MTDPSVLAEMARMRTEHEKRIADAAQLKARLILRYPLLRWDVQADDIVHEMIVRAYATINGVVLTAKISFAEELLEPERYIAHLLSKDLANAMLEWQPKRIEWGTP